MNITTLLLVAGATILVAALFYNKATRVTAPAATPTPVPGAAPAVNPIPLPSPWYKKPALWYAVGVGLVIAGLVITVRETGVFYIVPIVIAGIAVYGAGRTGGAKYITYGAVLVLLYTLTRGPENIQRDLDVLWGTSWSLFDILSSIGMDFGASQQPSEPGLSTDGQSVLGDNSLVWIPGGALLLLAVAGIANKAWGPGTAALWGLVIICATTIGIQVVTHTLYGDRADEVVRVKQERNALAVLNETNTDDSGGAPITPARPTQQWEMLGGVEFVIPAMGTKSVPRPTGAKCNTDDISPELSDLVKRDDLDEWVVYTSTYDTDVTAYLWFYTGKEVCDDIALEINAGGNFFKQ